MSDDISEKFLKLIELYKVYKKINNNRYTRRWKVRPINKNWHKFGYHRKVFLKIKSEDEEQFFVHTRMTVPIFNLLLSLIENSLIKPKQRIDAEERLSITLL